MEKAVEGLIEDALTTLTGFESAVDRLVWERDGDAIITPSDLWVAVDEELTELRESADDSVDLVQLGMMLSIVDHEFQLIIGSLRESMQDLRGWSDINPTFRPLVEQLDATFEHLDSYLALFTPLQRRSRRRPTVISGGDIYNFVQPLFERSLEESQIELTATPSFVQHEFRGIRSTWYPVFVNLIDNAVYWLREAVPPRQIRLDIDGEAMVVADSGPGVAPEDTELIFQPRFTLKPGGRGLGLTISREVLAREHYCLDVRRDHLLSGAAFGISPITEGDSR